MDREQRWSVVLAGRAARLLLVGALAVWGLPLQAQEICNNGIDDTGNGLIDLNDPDCSCALTGGGVGAAGFVANGSFDALACCPSGFSQMNCAASWSGPSTTTPDFNHVCGYMSAVGLATGILPPPGGGGCVGMIITEGWYEYIASCLLQPLVGGQQYELTMNIASSPALEQNLLCNTTAIWYGDIDLVLYGKSDCSGLGFIGTGCPTVASPAWQVIGSATYTPANAWSGLSISFTAPGPIAAIMFGAPCTLPPSYALVEPFCYPYFFVDDVEITEVVTTPVLAELELDGVGGPCTGDLVLAATSSVPGGTWNWFLNGVALAGAVTDQLDLSGGYPPPGTYSVVYWMPDGCVQADTLIEVPFSAPLTLVLSDGCQDEALDFGTLPPISAGASVVWDLGDGSPAVAQGTVTHAYDAPGAYPVTVSIEVAGCQFMLNDSVTVHPLPEVAISAPAVVCTGSPVLLQATGTPGVDHVWSLPTGDLVEGPFVTVASAGPADAGPYTVAATNVQGCSRTASVLLVVETTAVVQQTITLCGGVTLSLPDGSVVSTSGNYLVELGQTATGCDSLLQVEVIAGEDHALVDTLTICQGGSALLPDGSLVGLPGSYTTMLTTVTGCDSVIQTTVQLLPTPVVIFTWFPEDPLLAGGEVQFINDTQGASSYLWELGPAGTSSGISPVVTFPSGLSGTLPVCLTAYSPEGCSAVQCADLFLEGVFAFHCPNAFSPDADGHNDAFSPVVLGHSLDGYHFEVFDRWGRSLFESRDPARGWDGKFPANGEDVPIGVYAWQARVRPLGSTATRRYWGHVVLLR